MRLFFFLLCTEGISRSMVKILKGNGQSAEDR